MLFLLLVIFSISILYDCSCACLWNNSFYHITIVVPIEFSVKIESFDEYIDANILDEEIEIPFAITSKVVVQFKKGVEAQ